MSAYRRKLFCLIPVYCFLIAGCNNGNIESYKDKIDRFEMQVAETQVQDGIDYALKLSNEIIIENVTIPNHLSQPIPIIYKHRYEELGFDTSKMNFIEPQWYQNQQDFKTENAEGIELLNNGELNSHNHPH